MHIPKPFFPLLGLALALFCLSGSKPAEKSDPDLRTAIEETVHSWESMDMAQVSPHYAHDPDLPFFDLTPLKYANWTEYQAGAQKGLFDASTSIKATPNDDLHIHRQGNWAWATFTWRPELVNKSGAHWTAEARWTMILERRAGKWIVVHEHVSCPLPAQ